MKNKTPLRSEINDKDKWRVNDIYASDEAWESDYKEAVTISETACAYKGKLSKGEDIFYNALKEYYETEYMSECIYVYAFMKYYEDTSNPVYQTMSGKAQLVMIKLSEKYAFLEPEILTISDETMQKYLKDERIIKYKHIIEDMLEQKQHSLSEKEEELLAKCGQISSVPNEIFSKFNNADVKFSTIKDENGNEVELTNGKYSMFMESRNREVRKSAFYSLYKGYSGYINTLAAAFYGNVKQAVFYAEARKYESTLDMYLSGSFIPKTVYTNLISTVNDNLDLMHKYVAIRKKALGVSELHFYDIYAPMVEDYTIQVSYEEAKDIALKALAPLGKEYTDKVKEGFETGWVDVYENVGKRTGAFSWGAYGTHPYVFLNFTGTLNDIFTVVHEMGHAMHTYYSNSNQPYEYAGYKIFVAEVASTCNEALLIRYLLDNCTDVKEKKYLLNHYLDSFKGTLFRQTMFAEFEMNAHAAAEKGEVLNADMLCRMYKELNEKYFGTEMYIDEQISYEWARIPHFYTPFYVYQYATGFSAAIAIAAGILSGDENVLKGYKKFLSGGSSMHPIELLKLCGIDMNSPKVVADALAVFKNILQEWEKVVEK